MLANITVADVKRRKAFNKPDWSGSDSAGLGQVSGVLGGDDGSLSNFGNYSKGTINF